jgi:hypothetical protein
MLHKDYDRKGSVENKLLVVSLKGLDAKTNSLAVNILLRKLVTVVRALSGDLSFHQKSAVIMKQHDRTEKVGLEVTL